MNFRLTAILFGVVFAIGVALLILTFSGDDTKSAGDALTAELAGVKPDEIDAVEFERPDGGTLVIVRTPDKNWQIQKPFVARADAARVLPVISALLRAKPTQYGELRSDPAAHGLAPPSLKVTIRQGNERSSTVNLGDVTFGGEKGVVFVTTSSRPARPMAVRRGDLDPLFRESGDGPAGTLAKWTSDFRSPAVFPSDTRTAGDDVASLRLELPNKKKELALSREASGGWKFDSPAGWGAADPIGDQTTTGTYSGVRKLLGDLTSLSAQSPADFIETPKDLKEYGLNPDNPDLVKVTIKTRDGQTATAYIGKAEGPAPGTPPLPHTPGGKVFVRVEGTPGVIRATAGDLSGLVPVVNDPNPLRDRTLIAADRAADKADGVDIVLAGQPADKPTKLRRTGALRQWSLYGGPGDPQTAYRLAVDRLLDVILARRNIKDFPAPNPANFTAISATVFIWLDGFNPPPDPKAEPVKRGEPIKIEFGRKDGDTVYVRRTVPGQPPAEFAMPAQVKTGLGADTTDLLAAVTKTRLDLLDPALPTFGGESVAKVTVSGQNNYVLEKDEKPDPSTKEAVWRYAAPEPKGRTADARAVDELLRLLGTTQSVTRFVDEQPIDARLVDYGFLPAPRLKVVVGLTPGSPDKERVYEFGKDTADPNFVYARVPGKPAVFTLPRLVFDKFANPDLRDRLLFRAIDVARVNKVELRGWGHLGLGTIELTLEKNKDGVWTVTKGPPGFVVDPAKVNAFVELVARTRAKTLEQGPHNPKHGFTGTTFLEANISWPGGTAPLNLGASPDMGATYYGLTPWLPATDPVFTVDAAPFKPFKENPSGFAK